ncbi:MAG: SpvB/TcaC N-terminal domain-containing protein, partial [Verrucomicrobiota bacterium]
MKSKNMKRLWVGMMVLGLAGGALAQTTDGVNRKTSCSSDQQIQAKDLEGKRGQEQVDLFTGSFGYSIPIQCAPARNGSEPALALSYSSGGDLGWCGMGWKLDIGHIERNTKDGFPIQYMSGSQPGP